MNQDNLTELSQNLTSFNNNLNNEVSDLKSALVTRSGLQGTSNLFDILAVLHGKELKNGEIKNNEKYNVSDFMPVTPGDVVFIYAVRFTDYTNGYNVFFDFYRSDKTWISHSNNENTTTFLGAYYKAKHMEVPENAYYLRVQYSSTVADDDNIVVSLNEVFTEYIPFQKITAYPVNKNSQFLDVVSESDLINTGKSINLFDERKKLPNCVISNKNAFPKKWTFDTSLSNYCALNDILYLNPSILYRLCVFGVPSTVDAPYVVVYAFDSDDVYLTSANIGQGYADRINSIVYRRFKISDTISVSAHHYRIQISSTVQDYKIQLVPESEYSIYYHPYNELPYVRKDYIEGYVIDKVKNITSVGSNLVQIPQKYMSGVSAPLDDMTVMVNGIDFDYVSSENRCKLFGNNFSHDSSIVVYDGKIYCAFVGNKVSTGDNPSSPDAQTILSVVNVEGFGTSSVVTDYEIAKKDDAVGSKTIISGAGVPNIVAYNNIIRVFFSAKLSDNIYYMMYRDFNPSTNTLGNVTICNLSINGQTYDFSTPNVSYYIKTLQYQNYFISMNAMYGKSGSNYYCGMCIGSDIENSVILTTTDLETFSVWLIPEFAENCKANFEGACICVGDYLYYALRQNNTEPIASNRRMLLAKIKLSNGEIVDQCYITDTHSRPCWYYDGTDLYLIHNIIYRKRIEFIKINTSSLIDSNVVSIAGDHMVYPWIVKYGDYLYFSATGASSTHIYLRRVETFKRYTCKDVESKIASALNLNDIW